MKLSSPPVFSKRVFSALAALAGATLGVAGEINVPGDKATLSQAVSGASSGDVIVLQSDLVNGTVIDLSSKNLTVKSGTGLPTTITAASGTSASARIFNINYGNKLVFDNLVFRGTGDAVAATGAAINVTGGTTPTVGSPSTVSLAGSFTVTGFNIAGASTGAIYGGTTYSTLSLGSSGKTVTVSNNTSATGAGAGIRAWGLVSEGNLVIQNNVTSATAGGAGIFLSGSGLFNGTTTITGNVINATTGAGSTGAGITASGGLHFVGEATISDNSNSNGNGAGARAAADIVFDGNVTLANNTAQRVSATSANGGGLWAGTDLTISGAITATGNSAATNGGAIAVSNGSLKIGSGAVFRNNTAVAGLGGAIYVGAPVSSATSHRLDASSGDILFSGNVANGAPNGMYVALSGTVAQTLELLAGSGRTISFLDPLATSATGLLTVNKTGDGTVRFDTSVSAVTATTNVTAGTLLVTNGATYGSTAASNVLNVASGATLAGSGTIRANTITLADGAKLRATDGGTLTLTASTLTPAGSVALSGNGTIDAGVSLTASAVTAEDGGALLLAQATTMTNGGTLGGSGSIGGGVLTLTGATTLDSATTLGVSSVLTGAGSLTKTGAGTATLSGANTYSGGTSIAAGSLALTSASAAGTGAIANSGTLVADIAGTDTLTNAISGTGSLTKTGAGTLILAGTNTYTGATTVSQGALRLGATSAATLRNVALNGGTLDLNGFSASATSLSGTASGVLALNGATFTLSAATAQNYAGTLSGDAASAFVKSGAGALELSGTQPLANGFAGDITIAAGELDVTHGALTTTGDLNVQTGATLGLAAGDATVSAGTVTFGANARINITSTSGLGTIDLLTSSAPIVGTASLRLNGAEVASTLDQYLSLQLSQSLDQRTLSLVSGLTWNNLSGAHGTFNVATGQSFTAPAALADNTTFTTALGNWDGRTLTKTSAGTLVFANANSYTGATDINAGTLRLEAANAIATSSRVTVASGATLQLAADQSVRELSGAGAIDLGSAALTTNNTSAATLSGAISGSGRIVKTGAGTLTLSGQSSYSGGTTVSAGRVVATSASALGTGALVNNSEVEFAGVNGSFGGAISGTGRLIKSGAGNTVLAGVSGTAGAISVDGGTLTIGNGQTASNFTAGSVSVASGTALTVDRNSTLAVTGALNLASNSTLNLVVGATMPVISAGTANIATTGTTLNISGITGGTVMPFTLLSATNGITGDFARINVGGASGSSSDYLVVSAIKNGNSYVLGTNLVWNSPSANPNGVFTLANAGEFFDLGTVLANQAANSATGWDGKSLTKVGIGTLNLSATNTYTGATNVEGGRLRFGVGDSIATSSAVRVAASAIIDMNNTDQHLNNLSGAGEVWMGLARLTVGSTTDTTFSGVLSGTGRLIKEGGATLTLSGANTYSGGTTISGGRLSVTNLNALGTGAVTNNGALEFGATATGTYAADISGTGSITKLGSGLLTITGASGGFTGATMVEAGTLSVNGRLGGTLRLGSGATLQGNGTVGTTTALSGSHISPGNSIGTLNVLGNLTFASGSVYDVEIAPDGTNDRIDVSGTATIESGASVQVTKAGTYTYGTRYTILTAGGGINGNFSQIVQNAPLIDLIFFREGNTLYLDVRRNTIAFEAYSRTPNQWAIAGAVQARGPTDSIFRHITDALDEATVRQGFNHLSGEVHASFQSGLIDEARLVREAQQGRESLLYTGKGKLPAGARAWAQVLGGNAKTDGGDEWADATRTAFGVLAGVDNNLNENTRLGLVVGVTKSKLEADSVASSISSRNVHIGAQASTRLARWPQLTLSGGVGYSRHYADAERDPLITTFSEHLESRRRGKTLQGFGEASWFVPTKHGGFEPFVNVAIVRVETDDFAEKGGYSALLGAAEGRTARLGTVGSRLVHSFAGARQFRVSGSLGWQHLFEGATATQHLSYSGGQSFLITGTPLDRDTIAAELGFGFELVRALRLDLGYSGRLSQESRDHAARLVVSRAF